MSHIHFNSRWFIYFFAGFMAIALAIAVTGVNIAFWQEYTLYEGTDLEVSGIWYNIQRFDNSFWDTFNGINTLWRHVLFKIPMIPSFPYLENGFLDFFIFIANFVCTFVNIITGFYNTIVDVFTFAVSFVNTFITWVATAGEHIVHV